MLNVLTLSMALGLIGQTFIDPDAPVFTPIGSYFTLDAELRKLEQDLRDKGAKFDPGSAQKMQDVYKQLKSFGGSVLAGTRWKSAHMISSIITEGLRGNDNRHASLPLEFEVIDPEEDGFSLKLTDYKSFAEATGLGGRDAVKLAVNNLSKGDTFLEIKQLNWQQSKGVYVGNGKLFARNHGPRCPMRSVDAVVTVFVETAGYFAGQFVMAKIEYVSPYYKPLARDCSDSSPRTEKQVSYFFRGQSVNDIAMRVEFARATYDQIREDLRARSKAGGSRIQVSEETFSDLDQQFKVIEKTLDSETLSNNVGTPPEGLVKKVEILFRTLANLELVIKAMKQGASEEKEENAVGR